MPTDLIVNIIICTRGEHSPRDDAPPEHERPGNHRHVVRFHQMMRRHKPQQPRVSVAGAAGAAAAPAAAPAVRHGAAGDEGAEAARHGAGRCEGSAHDMHERLRRLAVGVQEAQIFPCAVRRPCLTLTL